MADTADETPLPIQQQQGSKQNVSPRHRNSTGTFLGRGRGRNFSRVKWVGALMVFLAIQLLSSYLGLDLKSITETIKGGEDYHQGASLVKDIRPTNGNGNNEEKLTASPAQLSSKKRIAILMLGDEHLFTKKGNQTGQYYLNWKSIERYASKQGYDALQIDRNFIPQCANVTQRYWYSKQCTVAHLLEKYVADDSYDWITVVDGDTAVVNDERRLEEYIPQGNVAHLIFYTRNHFEVMAGNVMASVSAKSAEFHRKWADMISFTGTFIKNENVLLHQHLANTLDMHECDEHFRKYKDWEGYFRSYVRCFNCNLLKKYDGDLKDMNGLVTIHRRDHGFATDIHASWTKQHLMYHGIKDGSELSLIDDTHRVDETQFLKELPKMKWRLQNYGDYVMKSNDDITGCWPSCPPKYDNETLETLYKNYRCDNITLG